MYRQILLHICVATANLNTRIPDYVDFDILVFQR